MIHLFPETTKLKTLCMEKPIQETLPLYELITNFDSPFPIHSLSLSLRRGGECDWGRDTKNSTMVISPSMIWNTIHYPFILLTKNPRSVNRDSHRDHTREHNIKKNSSCSYCLSRWKERGWLQKHCPAHFYPVPVEKNSLRWMHFFLHSFPTTICH